MTKLERMRALKEIAESDAGKPVAILSAREVFDRVAALKGMDR